MNTTLVRRRIRRRIAATAGALALSASALVMSAASPAQATRYCDQGLEVVGAIEHTYVTHLGGPGGVLGCPVSNELTNPDQFGRRSEFERGMIYWSPRSGAFPVWGALGEWWAGQRYETGWAGYPTSFEYTVGNEIRQNFQCAVAHFQAGPAGSYQTWGDHTCV
ncbi:LGFP repeat-containing protein [Kitasatospora sp. NPDC050543]|uniref:LGFP repeat-containing protein n=1 Tax=Kitasatospora sp. NPDC050543 TaxID=3364054 RepID=UPI003795C654